MKTVDKVGSMFIRAVLKRMKELGLNQSTLSRRMKASRPYVIKVLRGDVSVTLRTACRFAKALEMDFFPTLVPKEKGTPPVPLNPQPSTLLSGENADAKVRC